LGTLALELVGPPVLGAQPPPTPLLLGAFDEDADKDEVVVVLVGVVLITAGRTT
jgi:hypothetical protein